MADVNGGREVTPEVADLGLRDGFQAPTIRSSAVLCKACCPPDKSWEMRMKEPKPKKLRLQNTAFERFLINILTK